MASPRRGYDLAVQEVELALLVISAFVIVAAIAVRYRTRLVHRPLLLGALLGIVPGIVGSVVVLVPRTDLIPDAAEPYLWLTIGFIASGIALFALSRGAIER